MPEPSSAPQRTLSTFDAACVVIGAIVGVGIFFSPGKTAAAAGNAGNTMAAWALGGFIALCGALAFAELGRRRNGPGGQYEVLRDAYGPWGRFIGFLFVFCNAVGVQAGSIAVIAYICANNIAVAVRPADAGALPASKLQLLGAGLIVLVTLANAVGVKFGAWIQNLTVIAKISALAGIAILASTAPASHFVDPPAAPPTSATWIAILAGLVPAFFAYGGWQHALWISGEIKNPKRALPIAILSGTAVVVVIYLAANWAYLTLLGYDGVVSASPLAAQAVSTRLPDSGAHIMAAAVAISAFGVLNAQLLSGPRLVQALAADGAFFSIFRHLHPRWGSPLAAILMLGGAGLTILLCFGDKELLPGVVVLDGLFFALTAAAVFLLAKPADGSLPGARIAAALFIAGEIGILIGAHQDPKARIAAWIALGLVPVAGLLYAIGFRSVSAAIPHKK